MQPSIPANQIVNVLPNVLSAGGSALDVIGLLLTESVQAPIGNILGFPNQASVASYFGSGSNEADFAAKYFLGYNGKSISPEALLIAQYPATAVAAYERGGDVSGLTNAQLRAISGTLTAVIDGYNYPIASLDLSAAASPSAAAATIQTGLNATKPTQASMTGSIATTVLTVTAVISGTLAVGQVISGAGITVGTKITALGTGTGGIGTYTVSVSQTAASTTVTGKGADVVVTYDSLSGGFVITSGSTGATSAAAYATGTAAAPLKLTAATGAILSQGSAAATPGGFMDGVILSTQNFVTFATLFDPDVTGHANKLAFATWTNNQDNQFSYVCWDTDASPGVSVPATSSLGYDIGLSNLSGTFLISAPDYQVAAMTCGTAGSINFDRTNGRITFAFRQQDGVSPTVSDATAAENLIANGYNFYGAYATRSQNFNFLYPGQVSGKFEWMDSYINQIQLNNALQQAIFSGLTNVGSIPYNSRGYAMIEAFCMDPINAALNFGSIRPGVTLSAAQVAEVNEAAGAVVAPILQTRGWYLQIKDATPQVRAARGSPPCTLWYMDGGSVQKVTLDSIEIQ